MAGKHLQLMREAETDTCKQSLFITALQASAARSSVLQCRLALREALDVLGPRSLGQGWTLQPKAHADSSSLHPMSPPVGCSSHASSSSEPSSGTKTSSAKSLRRMGNKLRQCLAALMPHLDEVRELLGSAAGFLDAHLGEPAGCTGLHWVAKLKEEDADDQFFAHMLLDGAEVQPDGPSPSDTPLTPPFRLDLTGEAPRTHAEAGPSSRKRSQWQSEPFVDAVRLHREHLLDIESEAEAMQHVLPTMAKAAEKAANESVQALCATLPLGKPNQLGSTFQCPICLDDEVHMQDCFLVSTCGHRLCRSCAVRTVKHNIQQQEAQSCPSCMGAPCPSCPVTVWKQQSESLGASSSRHEPPAAPHVRFCCMEQRDLRLLLQPEELQGAAAAAHAGADEGAEAPASPPPTFESYLRTEALRVAHQQGLFKLCPKCGEGVELDPGIVRLICPTCNADHCMSCGVDWHEGTSCAAYQEWSKQNASADEEFQKLHASMDFKACPNCGNACQKVSGCNHVRCAKCKCPFCYGCGKMKSGKAAHSHSCECDHVSTGRVRHAVMNNVQQMMMDLGGAPDRDRVVAEGNVRGAGLREAVDAMLRELLGPDEAWMPAGQGGVGLQAPDGVAVGNQGPGAAPAGAAAMAGRLPDFRDLDERMQRAIRNTRMGMTALAGRIQGQETAAAFAARLADRRAQADAAMHEARAMQRAMHTARMNMDAFARRNLGPGAAPAEEVAIAVPMADRLEEAQAFLHEARAMRRATYTTMMDRAVQHPLVTEEATQARRDRLQAWRMAMRTRQAGMAHHAARQPAGEGPGGGSSSGAAPVAEGAERPSPQAQPVPRVWTRRKRVMTGEMAGAMAMAWQRDAVVEADDEDTLDSAVRLVDTVDARQVVEPAADMLRAGLVPAAARPARIAPAGLYMPDAARQAGIAPAGLFMPAAARLADIAPAGLYMPDAARQAGRARPEARAQAWLSLSLQGSGSTAFTAWGRQAGTWAQRRGVQEAMVARGSGPAPFEAQGVVDEAMVARGSGPAPFEAQGVVDEAMAAMGSDPAPFEAQIVVDEAMVARGSGPAPFEAQGVVDEAMVAMGSDPAPFEAQSVADEAMVARGPGFAPFEAQGVDPAAELRDPPQPWVIGNDLEEMAMMDMLFGGNGAAGEGN